MIKKERYYLLGLLIVAITAYWQISFFQYSLKYDMIDCSYPWRYIVSEHLRNGMLPMWNPYQNLGYPLFADLQSGSPWYLPVWILSVFSAYNIYTLSFEFIFHIFMAGVGMFYLGKTLKLSLNTAFIMGLAYMLSGFFIGNAQHFTLIAGATWLPFILSGYFEIIHKNNIRAVIKTAFFFFLFIAGGYPTYVVTTAYILCSLFVAYTLTLIKKKERVKLRQFILNNLYLFIFTVLLSCVVLLSYIDIAPELTRTEGIDLKAAMLNPFSPQCMLSLILPYGVIKDMAFFNTDLSMSNAYLGLIPLIFLCFSFFVRKSKAYYFFLVLALFSLLVAMGDYLPVRKILFNYVPLMNLFRFPGVFRLFTIVGFIVCAGFGIDYYIKDNIKSIILINGISTVFVMLFLGITFYSRAQGYLEIKKFVTATIFTESQTSSLTQHIAFQSFIQIMVLFSFILALRFLKNNTHFIYFVAFIVALEMGLAAQLNAPYTVFYQNIKQEDVMLHHKSQFKVGFPLSDTTSVSENTNARLSYGPFWRNLTIFHKQVSNEGFTSLVLRNYRDMTKNYPVLLDSLLKNPPLFITADIAPFDSLNLQATNAGKVFFDRKTFNSLSSLIHYDKPDYKIKIAEFKPGTIKLKTNSFANQVLVLLQNNYKGWKAYVNEKEVPILTADKSLMALYLPKGENTIIFTFEKPLIVFGFYVSLLSLLVFGGLGGYYLFKSIIFPFQ